MTYPHVVQFGTRKHELEDRLRLLEIRWGHLQAAKLKRRSRPAGSRPSRVARLTRVLRIGLG